MASPESSSSKPSTAHPWWIVVFCVLCFIRAFVNMILIAFPPGGQTGELPFLCFMTLGLLGAMFGFWLMKRWGVYLVGALLVLFMALKWETLHGVDPSIFLYLFGLVAGALSFKKMS